ncbi:carbohydrate sulfotransferase 12-like [Anoplopoma fimbria]|uniref:carbohydrate sulfotransferase 12-like n=1 Tax=Anoplopoma fimbria TaxID=229290 RepID=UPI0023EB0908|nr:carbohydrate sulfotransferase 12-like [Anoplopoma fimbria]
MKESRLFLLLLFVGPIFLVVFTFYKWDKSQEEREEIHRMQELRKQLLRSQCDGDVGEFPEGKRSLEDMSDQELSNLIVDDKHGIIYCYIPKVACSNWKKFFLVLNQSNPNLDPMSISSETAHINIQFNLLNRFPRSEMKEKLNHYTKFLYVRDPFVRLISAFRSKFQKPDEHFYKLFGRDILRMYGNQSDLPKTVEKAFASGLHVSFYNFIQYLVDPRTEQPFEPHWRQMHRLCHPCLIRYDFIGHLETLQQDTEQLLEMLNLEVKIKFPPSHVDLTSSDALSEWYSTVPLEDRRKLYTLYEEDFRLFGFRKPTELLDG